MSSLLPNMMARLFWLLLPLWPSASVDCGTHQCDEAGLRLYIPKGLRFRANLGFRVGGLGCNGSQGIEGLYGVI